MARGLAIAVALVFVVPSFAASPDAAVRVELREKSVAVGPLDIVLSVYASEEGGAPLATETRRVRFESGGVLRTTLGSLAAAAGGEQRWIGVRVGSGEESRRVPLVAGAGRDVKVDVVTDAAITANGLVESIAQGFRFPDGSVQTSAATASGGVPSVNGITGAVTIAGAGTASVGTAGGTITVTGSGITGVTAGTGLTGGGTSGNPTVSATYGTPVNVGTSNSAGVANTLARSDHVHAHGNQSGGTLHSAATTSTAGFLSSTDKTKLDATLAYAHTVLVSSGGSAAANGTALIAALAAITTNSSSNPYLIKLEGGVYDVGSTGITMKSYVDIEGSGQTVTYINGAKGSAATNLADHATVNMAGNSELRSLTVTNTASSSIVSGVFVNSSPAKLRDIAVTASGATSACNGVQVQTNGGVTIIGCTITATSSGSAVAAGIRQDGLDAAATLQNSSVTAGGNGNTNYGIILSGTNATATVDSSTVYGTGGASSATGLSVSVGTGTATITNSTIKVDTATTRTAAATSGSGATLNISHSLILAGGPSLTSSILSLSKGASTILNVATSQVDSASAGTPKCVHVYDGDMDDLNNVCPLPIG